VVMPLGKHVGHAHPCWSSVSGPTSSVPHRPSRTDQWRRTMPGPWFAACSRPCCIVSGWRDATSESSPPGRARLVDRPSAPVWNGWRWKNDSRSMAAGSRSSLRHRLQPAGLPFWTARPLDPGRTRRMCGNPACHAGNTNENAQLRTVGR
jgi:hypothetical protein